MVENENAKLVRNIAKCLLCGETIESKYRNNYVSCSCGNLAVDGGTSYLRRVYGKQSTWEDLSEYETNP